MIDNTRLAPSFLDVSGLLEPRSVAVIGASDRPGSLGGTAFRFLQKFPYPGALWPVNPRQQTVGGLPCYASPRDLPGPADLAVLAIPAEAIVDAVRQCAEAGIRFGVVWAGGFAEVGGEGIERQRALENVCRETGFKVCGPNCIGVINGNLPMTASFASSLLEADRLIPGNISIVSQSGGTAVMCHALAMRAGFGFRYVISSGNEAVVTTADYLHALVQDPQTRVIAAYLEGLRDGPKFLAALEEARLAGKPVVMLKAGATSGGAAAAVAHTGALAGEDRVWDAIFREQAVLRVDSWEELLDVSIFVSTLVPNRLPKGNGVASMSFGGGPGVLAADHCARYGLTTPPLPADARERLQPLVPPIASIANPFDFTPEAFNQPNWLALFPQALDVVAADPNLHSLFLQVGGTAHKAKEVMDVICGLRSRTDKPLCVSWSVAPRSVVERLPVEGVYPFPDQARATRAIGQVVRYAAALERPRRPESVELPAFDWSTFVPHPTPGTVVSEHQCHRILAAAGLPVAAGRLATGAEEAVLAAAAVGYPVALKGISPAVTHRAAAGLLALDLRTDREVRDAYHALLDRARGLGVELEGGYIQHMVKGGVELLVSAFRDPQFGMMVSCGAGGNMTEVLDDVTLERAPVDVELALHMLRQLRLVRYLRRRDATVDLAAAAEFVSHFSKLAATAPWSRFVLEVNPIKVGGEGVAAVDGLLVVEAP